MREFVCVEDLRAVFLCRVCPLEVGAGFEEQVEWGRTGDCTGIFRERLKNEGVVVFFFYFFFYYFFLNYSFLVSADSREAIVCCCREFISWEGGEQEGRSAWTLNLKRELHCSGEVVKVLRRG